MFPLYLSLKIYKIKKIKYLMKNKLLQFFLSRNQEKYMQLSDFVILL